MEMDAEKTQLLAEIEALKKENQRLRLEVQRWRGAFELGSGKQRPQGEGVSAIESRYPHIASKILGFWGSAQLLPYLNSLLLDDRGDRQGFAFDALLEMQMLKDVHLEAFPQHPDWEDLHLR